MLHTYVQRFDVTENLENFCKILRTKQAPGLLLHWTSGPQPSCLPVPLPLRKRRVITKIRWGRVEMRSAGSRAAGACMSCQVDGAVRSTCVSGLLPRLPQVTPPVGSASAETGVAWNACSRRNSTFFTTLFLTTFISSYCAVWPVSGWIV